MLAIVWMTCLPENALGAMCPAMGDSARRTAVPSTFTSKSPTSGAKCACVFNAAL